MLPVVDNVISNTVKLDPKTSILDDRHQFSELWQKQPIRIAQSKPKLDKSSRFVKSQAKQISLARHKDVNLKQLCKARVKDHHQK